jgi:hypothetical protein
MERRVNIKADNGCSVLQTGALQKEFVRETVGGESALGVLKRTVQRKTRLIIFSTEYLLLLTTVFSRLISNKSGLLLNTTQTQLRR